MQSDKERQVLQYATERGTQLKTISLTIKNHSRADFSESKMFVQSDGVPRCA